MLETDLDADPRECAETIASSPSALLSILDDGRGCAKIEAGVLRLGSNEAELSNPVEPEGTLHAMRAHDAGSELIVAIDPDVP